MKVVQEQIIKHRNCKSMKKIQCLLGIMILMSVFSCTKQDDGVDVNKVSSESQLMTFKASLAEYIETKTAFQSSDAARWPIYWTPGDAINIFYGKNNAARFETVAAFTEAGPVTEFEGYLKAATGAADENGEVSTQNFWAVYPYDESNTCDGNSVTFTIPSVQTGVAGTFANNLNPSIACSSNMGLAFYNAASWFIFSVTQENVVSATLTGACGETLVGKVKVSMDSNKRPVIDEVTDGQTSVILTPEDGSFQVGEYYVMVILPQTFAEGVKLTLTKGDGTQAVCTVRPPSGDPMVVARSEWARKKQADKDLVYEQTGNIVFADPAVKSICVANWDTDGDGELSYGEAVAVTTLGSVFSKNTDIASFEELQYFTGLQNLNKWGIEDNDIYGTVFENCTNLRKVVLPSSLNQISSGAFRGCVSLTSIVIPNSVTAIGRSAFNGCSSLIDVVLPEGMTYIGKYAFAEAGLHTINLPDGLTTIDDGAFIDCSDLSIDLYVKESISTMGKGAFARTSIQNVLVDVSAQNAFKNAFKWGESTGENSYDRIRDVTILNNKNIQYSLMGLFNGFSSLVKVVLPEGLHFLGYTSFLGCSALTNIDLPSSLTGIGMMAFQSCDNLRSIIIPDGVVSIGEKAFALCTSMTSVSLPSSLTRIDKWAFGRCERLQNIIIPSGLVEIGEMSFKQCSSLQSFTVLATEPPILGNEALMDTNNCPIYVPAESVDTYKTADGWSTYADRIMAMPDGDEDLYVDLGLPSGVKWAKCNLGASAPEEYGDYYAWGETEPYYTSISSGTIAWKSDKSAEGYWWPSYAWSMDVYNTLTKYNDNEEYGYNGFTDNKTMLDIEDDAARAVMGGTWRMPTSEEIRELQSNCTWTMTSLNGVNGYQVKGPNGNTIFLPSAGIFIGTDLEYRGSCGYYLSSSLSTVPHAAQAIYFNQHSHVGFDSDNRCRGYSIRPVK